MVYLFQWCHWRTRDPEADAIRGCHDKNQAPLFDLLTEFGKLRRKLRERVGYDVLSQEYWVHSMSEEKLLENLPKPHLGHSRLTGKTQPPVPPLGARESTKPADWPRGPASKGILEESRQGTRKPRSKPTSTTAQEASNTAEEASATAQEASSTAQEAIKTAQEASTAEPDVQDEAVNEV